MAVVTSNKATDTTVKDFKYFTGVIPFKVVAVNPDLAELKTLGIEYMQKEPEYVVTQDFGTGPVTNSILDFWVKSVPNDEFPEMEILNNIRFRINKTPWLGSNTGKYKAINKYGRVSGWISDMTVLEGDKYYVNDESRQMHRGEEELHKFLFAWLNMTYDTKSKQYDECRLTISKLISGDFSEVKDIVKASSEFTVKILTGINVVEKDGKIRYYQDFYNQMFLKHNQTSTNRLEEFVNKDDYTEFKADFYSYDIQEFDKSVRPDEDVKEESKEEVKDIF